MSFAYNTLSIPLSRISIVREKEKEQTNQELFEDALARHKLMRAVPDYMYGYAAGVTMICRMENLKNPPTVNIVDPEPFDYPNADYQRGFGDGKCLTRHTIEEIKDQKHHE